MKFLGPTNMKNTGTGKPELKMIDDKYQDKDNLILNNTLSDVK